MAGDPRDYNYGFHHNADFWICPYCGCNVPHGITHSCGTGSANSIFVSGSYGPPKQPVLEEIIIGLIVKGYSVKLRPASRDGYKAILTKRSPANARWQWAGKGESLLDALQDAVDVLITSGFEERDTITPP